MDQLDMDNPIELLDNTKEILPAKVENSSYLSSYIQASTSQNTRKAYRQDVQHFIAWGGLLPTTVNTIIRYLHDHADILNPRTLSRRLTALKHWHTYQEFPDPTDHPLVRKTLTGIQNIHGRPKEKAPAITMDQLAEMVAYLYTLNTLQGIRNSALLQIGFFGAFRRSELSAMQWEHINFVAEGIEILIPRSKGDQAGEGQVCAIPYGDETLCPVTALKVWRDYSNQASKFVFCAINKHDLISSDKLSTDGIGYIIKTTAIQSNLPQAEKMSGHSLRRGFATETSKKGASFVSIMRHGRWKHEKTVLGYIEEGQRFIENAASQLFKK